MRTHREAQQVEFPARGVQNWEDLLPQVNGFNNQIGLSGKSWHTSAAIRFP